MSRLTDSALLLGDSFRKCQLCGFESHDICEFRFWTECDESDEREPYNSRFVYVCLRSNRVPFKNIQEIIDAIKVGRPIDVTPEVRRLAKQVAEQRGKIDELSDEEKEKWARKLAADVAHLTD